VRPTLLTPEVQATIVEAIRKGHYRETAAHLAGITRRTINNWEQRGETGEAPYDEFFRAIKKAEAEAEDALLDDIRTAQPGIPGEGGRGADLWQAKAWVMERRWPGRWGGRVRATVQDELAAVLKRIETKLDAETFAKVVDATREDASSASATPARH
jgi:transposase